MKIKKVDSIPNGKKDFAPKDEVARNMFSMKPGTVLEFIMEDMKEYRSVFNKATRLRKSEEKLSGYKIVGRSKTFTMYVERPISQPMSQENGSIECPPILAPEATVSDAGVDGLVPTSVLADRLSSGEAGDDVARRSSMPGSDDVTASRSAEDMPMGNPEEAFESTSTVTADGGDDAHSGMESRKGRS